MIFLSHRDLAVLTDVTSVEDSSGSPKMAAIGGPRAPARRTRPITSTPASRHPPAPAGSRGSLGLRRAPGPSNWAGTSSPATGSPQMAGMTVPYRPSVANGRERPIRGYTSVQLSNPVTAVGRVNELEESSHHKLTSPGGIRPFTAGQPVVAYCRPVAQQAAVVGEFALGRAQGPPGVLPCLEPWTGTRIL